MKTILVTGSNGLLGQKLIDKLRNRSDIRLIACSKGENRYPENTGYEYVSLDITSSTEIADVFRQYRPNAVINTAAMTNVDACEIDKVNCDTLNVEAVHFLVESCNKYEAQLIHLSTDFIFDGETGPYSEEDAPNPLSYYGQSKLRSEELLKQNCKSWAIIRTIIVYGIVKDMSRTNIVLWAKSALEKKETIRVVDDQFRCPTLAEDLADACISAAMKNAQGVFHVSGKDYMSMIELVSRVADFFGLNKQLIQPISSSSLNQTAKRPARTGFILNRAMNELDYKPHSFEEGLAILQKQLVE